MQNQILLLSSGYKFNIITRSHEAGCSVTLKSSSLKIISNICPRVFKNKFKTVALSFAWQESAALGQNAKQATKYQIFQSFWECFQKLEDIAQFFGGVERKAKVAEHFFSSDAA